MKMSEDVRIEIPGNQLVDNNKVLVNEWEECIRGHEFTHRKRLIGKVPRKRLIGKVPPMLLNTEKGCKNRDYYKPLVVSLGPYHYDPTHFAQAEMYKFISLEEYRFSCDKSLNLLYKKVFEVAHDARACYVDGTTNHYSDEEFSGMMLRDGCFILFFIECISRGDTKMVLNNEYLGASGFANVVRDLFLLENQIPFVVLEVLLDLRFPQDKGEEILNRFFNYLNYGEGIMRNDEKVLGEKKPLHLLELYRSCFISLSASLGHGSTNVRKWKDFNYVKRNRSFASVMELKAKGIFLRRAQNESSNEDIKFHSHCCYGELELVRRAVYSNTKAIYLNMIAYEMCPHNPNDFRVSTYVRVMKSLVVHGDDVKELRNSNILLHSLGRDEEVVKMFDEFEVPAVNLFMFNHLRQGIEKHCNNKYKTWAAELIALYFSSPWKMVALFVASAILFTSFLQTYFTIRPLPDDSNEDMMRLLRRCAHFHPPPTPP